MVEMGTKQDEDLLYDALSNSIHFGVFRWFRLKERVPIVHTHTYTNSISSVAAFNSIVLA